MRPVASPLTSEMLSPPDEECRWVQFEQALTDADYRELGDWLTQYPDLVKAAKDKAATAVAAGEKKEAAKKK